MYPVSDAFLDAIRGGGEYKLTTRASLLTGSGTEPIDLLDGTVTANRSAASRRTCDVVLPPDVSLIPTDPGSALAPYGNEIKLERGVRFPDGSTELVPLGVFRLEDVDADATPGGLAIRCSGVDRSIWIIEPGFEGFHQTPEGTNAVEEAVALVEDAYPRVVWAQVAETDVTLPKMFANEGDDIWEYAQTCALAAGMSLYFDRDGYGVIEPAAQYGDPVETIAGGDALLSVARRLSREGTPNRIKVYGEAASETGDVPEGIAIDDDPESPTYYYGRFGKKTQTYTYSEIRSDAQAQYVAEIILALRRGIARTIAFESLVNPALGPDDCIRLVHEGTGLDQTHLIDSLTIPLSASSSSSATTRQIGGEVT